MVTYRTLLTKTTNFLKSGGYKIWLYLRLFLLPHNIKLIQGFNVSFWRKRQDRMRNRFYASFRKAANTKRTPWLMRKVKYTRAPQTVHNTPVMKILKGFFYITLFWKKHIKETKVKFKISAQLPMHIGGKFRKMMGGRIARRMQSDDTWTLSVIHKNKVMCKISAQHL